MGQSHQHQTTTTTTTPSVAASSRQQHGMRGGGNNNNVGGGGYVGEIVEVQGGHIVRSTGRKDRHSKVCTAKGPRDRRVRLSAPTAIQFYDVQDRLGYDRPSKAVDWLIKKAKTAIDELAKLPAWKPTAAVDSAAAASGSGSKTTAMVGVVESDELENFQHQQQQMSNNENNNNNNNSGTGFLPPSLDSDAIADTIKSFFPMGASGDSSSSSIQFQSYPPDLLSRTSSQSQDLRLSLQSFQDPMLLHHHHQQQQQQTQQSEQMFGFDGFQRMVVPYGAAAADSGNAAFVFNSQQQPSSQQQLLQQQLFGGGGGHQSQFFTSQRGPLQSSNTPSVRAWIDNHPGYHVNVNSTSASLNHYHHHHQQVLMPNLHHHPQAFAFGGFPGFHVPTRIQGEEEHDGMPNKPSSASSDSHGH